MIDVAVRRESPEAVDEAELVDRLRWTCQRLGVTQASAGLMIVGAERMRELNRAHRGIDRPTDVLSFPVDGPELSGWPAGAPPPELGDIVICPAAASDPLAALVLHGVLHLLGYDHETDDGEMLALEDELLAAASPS